MRLTSWLGLFRIFVLLLPLQLGCKARKKDSSETKHLIVPEAKEDVKLLGLTNKVHFRKLNIEIIGATKKDPTDPTRNDPMWTVYSRFAQLATFKWLMALESQVPKDPALVSKIVVEPAPFPKELGEPDLKIEVRRRDLKFAYALSQEVPEIKFRGDEAFCVYLHELGHAFGLADTYIPPAQPIQQGPKAQVTSGAEPNVPQPIGPNFQIACLPDHGASVMCNSGDLTNDDLSGIAEAYKTSLQNNGLAKDPDLKDGELATNPTLDLPLPVTRAYQELEDLYLNELNELGKSNQGLAEAFHPAQCFGINGALETLQKQVLKRAK